VIEKDDRPTQPPFPKRKGGRASAPKPRKPKPKKRKKPKKPKKPKTVRESQFVTYACSPSGSPSTFTLTSGVNPRLFHSFGFKLASLSGSEVISVRGVDGGGGVLFAGGMTIPVSASDVWGSVGSGGGGSTNDATVQPLPNACYLPSNGKVIVETSGTSGGVFSDAVFTYEELKPKPITP